MILGYYEARQWDENGFVPARKLDELGISNLCVGPDRQMCGILRREPA